LPLSSFSQRSLPEFPGESAGVLQSFRVGGQPVASVMLASFGFSQRLRGLVGSFAFGSQAADRCFGLNDLLADYSQVDARSLVGDLRLADGLAVGASQEPSRLVCHVQFVAGLVESYRRLVAPVGEPVEVLLGLDKSLVQLMVCGCLWSQESDLLRPVWTGGGVDLSAGIGQGGLQRFDVHRCAEGGADCFGCRVFAARASQDPGQDVVWAGRRMVLVFVG
jgi:hypothetical protein